MKMVVVLDNIRSVHNVGSIFRTADGVGVEKIYSCGITPGPLDRFNNVRADFAKVALGAEKSVAWEIVKDTADKSSALVVIEQLKKDGWQIFAIEQARGSIPYYEAPIIGGAGEGGNEEKIALVLGAEVEGVSAAVLAAADKILEILMQGKKESLNVAVAFGIVAFGLRDRVLQ